MSLLISAFNAGVHDVIAGVGRRLAANSQPTLIIIVIVIILSVVESGDGEPFSTMLSFLLPTNTVA